MKRSRVWLRSEIRDEARIWRAGQGLLQADDDVRMTEPRSGRLCPRRGGTDAQCRAHKECDRRRHAAASAIHVDPASERTRRPVLAQA